MSGGYDGETFTEMYAEYCIQAVPEQGGTSIEKI
jgi:hypothetical protein